MAIRTIRIYTDYKSPYAYLAKDLAYDLARETGITLDWLPYTLDIPSYLGSAKVDNAGGVLEESRNAHQWRRVKYSYMDCRREANLRGLTIRGTQKIWDSRKANIGLLYAKAQGPDVLKGYHDRVFERFWRRDLDIESTAVLAAVLAEAGADAKNFATYVEGEGLHALTQVQTEAEAAGVFGVPSLLLPDGDLYWGREHFARVREIIEASRRGPHPMSSTHRQAAEAIHKAWQAGEVIEALPEGTRPATRAGGYAIQAGLEAFSSAPRAGWKIAATSTAGQKHIGVDQPLAGRLFVERLLEPGANVSVAHNRMRVAEPEFAFRFARDIAPRATPYTTDEVMAAVGDLHLCIELPDSRFRDFAAAGGPSLIADNACTHELVVGPRVTVDWRAVDLARHPVHAEVGTRYTRDGIGSNVLGDPRAALAWLVNEVTGLGLTLSAGELVTTGTCVVPLEIEPGDEVRADFGTLGKIAVRIAS